MTLCLRRWAAQLQSWMQYFTWAISHTLTTVPRSAGAIGWTKSSRRRRPYPGWLVAATTIASTASTSIQWVGLAPSWMLWATVASVPSRCKRVSGCQVILGQHRPLYSSTVTSLVGLTKPTNDLPESKGMRASLEPLLLKYGVAAVVAGHYHQYERSCPIVNGSCAAPGQGIVHMTAGIAGLQHSADWLPSDKTPEWVVTQNNHQYGYVRFDVMNSTHMKVVVVDASDDSAFDHFWIQARSLSVSLAV